MKVEKRYDPSLYYIANEYIYAVMEPVSRVVDGENKFNSTVLYARAHEDVKAFMHGYDAAYVIFKEHCYCPFLD